MAKFGKREMIIFGVMAAVILYAAVDFLLPKKKNPAIDMVQKTAELNTFVNNLTTAIGTDTATGASAIIFSQAEKEWTQDPFLDSKSYNTWSRVKEGAGTAQKVEFVYSGYLEIGRKRMAIINGIEYKEGDALDIKGYILKSVSPTRVVIENRLTRATINIPLQE